MERLKEIIEDNNTRAGKVFDIFIQVLILTSLVSFSLDTLPDLNPKTRAILDIVELVTIIIFSIEYLLRILVSDKRFKFIFSFYGIIDLAAILPFYIASGIDLRSLRAFRLIRLLRTFKLLRYSTAITRFYNALKSVKEELLLFLFVTCILLFLSGTGIYFFENQAQPEVFKSIFDSLWWALATLTTVGYGDIFPITVGGKILTFFILLIGLGIIAVPTGLIASALSQTRKPENE